MLLRDARHVAAPLAAPGQSIADARGTAVPAQAGQQCHQFFRYWLTLE
jgi:hypothetical protein